MQLTPLLAKKFVRLILEQGYPQAVKREHIIKEAIARHIAEGGIPPSGKSAIVEAIKKLLWDGYVEAVPDVGPGWYKLRYTEECESVECDGEIADEEDDDETETTYPVVGDGPQSVYVYYYDGLRRLAGYEGRSIFPCKIGTTASRNIKQRIDQQIREGGVTAYPDRYVIALHVRCENGADLEGHLHAALRQAGFKTKHAPGKDWYDTRPDVIQQFSLTVIDYEAAKIRVLRELQDSHLEPLAAD